jgi:hypothetical protein
MGAQSVPILVKPAAQERPLTDNRLVHHVDVDPALDIPLGRHEAGILQLGQQGLHCDGLRAAGQLV